MNNLEEKLQNLQQNGGRKEYFPSAAVFCSVIIIISRVKEAPFTVFRSTRAKRLVNFCTPLKFPAPLLIQYYSQRNALAAATAPGSIKTGAPVSGFCSSFSPPSTTMVTVS